MLFFHKFGLVRFSWIPGQRPRDFLWGNTASDNIYAKPLPGRSTSIASRCPDGAMYRNAVLNTSAKDGSAQS